MIVSYARNIPYHLWTIFLFTKSDFKTSVFPCTIFGAAIAPVADYSRLLHVAFWSWIQILAFNIANQALFPKEDKANKPYRPIPAGRISVNVALKLRWIMVALSLVHSACYSVETFCIAVWNSVIVFLYCECRVDAAHWTVRHLIGGFGYIPYFAGAILIAGSDSHKIDNFGWYAIMIASGIYGTTFFAQDFKDVAGDNLVGRNTFPMVYPLLSRSVYLVLTILWSILMSFIFPLASPIAFIPMILGVFTGMRFVLLKSVKADQVSFVFNEVWVYSIFLVMGYYRFALQYE